MSSLPLLATNFLSAQIAEHDNNEKYLQQTGPSTEVRHRFCVIQETVYGLTRAYIFVVTYGCARTLAICVQCSPHFVVRYR